MRAFFLFVACSSIAACSTNADKTDGGPNGSGQFGGAGGSSCTPPCGPTAEIATPIDGVTDAQIQASTATVCRNGECYSSTLETLQSYSGGTEYLVQFPRPGEIPFAPVIVMRIEDGFGGIGGACEGRVLLIDYSPFSSGQGTNGDVFRVTLTSGLDHSVWLDATTTATYVGQDRCGVSCALFQGCAQTDAG